MKRLILAILLTPLLSMLGYSQSFLKNDTFKVELVSPYTSVKAGDSFKVLTKLSISDNWSAYYAMPGISNVGVSLEWKTPEGVTLKSNSNPVPKIKKGPAYYYKGEVWFISEFSSNNDIATGTLELTQKSKVQTCDPKTCSPPSSTTKSISINFSTDTSFSTDGEATLTKAVKYAVPSTPAENVEITADGNILKIAVTTEDSWNLEDGIVFIPSLRGNFNKDIDKSEVTKTANGYLVTYNLPATHEVKEEITGILTSTTSQLSASHKAILISSPIIGELTQAVAVAEGSHTQQSAWTEKEKAAHALLYKPEELIKHDKDAVEQGILTILILAFVGGAILNLMPCVFPVLGLKIMSFVQLAGDDPKKIKVHGLVFTGGVVLSMWILAGALLIIRTTTTINWGQQMGNPIFVGCIVILLFIMGLNMYGVFEMGSKLTSAGGNLQNKKGYSGSFFSGVLTTLIATPCSGPFLGATMGYTLQQSAITALIIFTIFALGVASPYLILAFMPKMINKLPNPGAWMEVFKKLMAFPLFATAVFFLSAFTGQTGTDGAFWLSMALVFFGMAAWAYGTWSLPYIDKKKRYIWGLALPAVILSGAVWMTSNAMSKKAPEKATVAHSEAGLNWQNWHPGIVEHLLSEDKKIWVDYTADW